MESRITDVASRIRTLREDTGLTMQEMAEATGLTVAEYAALEGGEQDLSVTVMYRVAEKLGVDIIDILTGEAPHLTGYSVVRAGRGLAIKRREGFVYRHLAPNFRHKLAEPFFVTAPYSAEEQDAPIALSRHAGQEFNYIISGHLRFAYEGHTEELSTGDSLLYDSGRGHGMVATGGEPCMFLAIVIKDRDSDVF
jgi:transcriptional regulator with XRE-family HTH domain